MDLLSLRLAVEDAFERTAHGLERWDDPHPPPDRVVADEEYSRVTNPEKWRVIGARADAWLEVLVANDLATVRRDAAVEWEEPPGPNVTRVDLVRPAVPYGLPLVIGRSRIETVDDAGVTVGVGLPAVFVHAIPDCGCDACDSVSAAVTAEIDTWLSAIVDGSFRHLSGLLGTLTVLADGMRMSSHRIELPRPTDSSGWRFLPRSIAAGAMRGAFSERKSRRFDVDAVLADATGWREWSGPPWFV